MAPKLDFFTLVFAVSLLLVSAFSPPVEENCSTKPDYVPGSDCCSNIVFLNFGMCCSDPTEPDSCYCDGRKFGGRCAASPVSPAPQSGSLCPKAEPVISGRLLGGTEVTDVCEGRGIVGLYADGRQFCNAVFAFNPATKQNSLYTLKSCMDTIQNTDGSTISVTGKIAGDSFNWDQCIWTSSSLIGNGDVAMVSLSPLAEYFLEKHIEKCSSPGCMYTSDTMSGALNRDQCYIVSHGYTSTGQSSFSKVNVKMADLTQCKNPVFGTQCFVSVDGGAPCLGDGGSPVYCNLTNGETTLYGILSSTNGCDAAMTSFNVLPLQ